MAFAGCTEHATIAAPEVAADVDPNLLAADGRDLRLKLEKTDAIEKPDWAIGHWFGHHVFFGGDDTEGSHYPTVVVRDDGADWFLATDDVEAAKTEAVFDLPLLGKIAKKDLKTTGLGATWEMYKFPLKDGLAWDWTGLVASNPTNAREMTLKYTVTYNPSIDTPDGVRPGFDITAKNADGKSVFFYDFVPDIGWYAHFYMYNVDTDAPDDYVLHSMSMGHGKDWKGTFFIDEAKVLLEEHNGVAADPDAPTTVPYANAKPLLTFTMDASAKYLMGFVYVVAFGGVQETNVIDPAANRHEYQAVGAPVAVVGAFVDTAAVPGDWKVVSVGAGAIALQIVFLWQVTETTGTL